MGIMKRSIDEKTYNGIAENQSKFFDGLKNIKVKLVNYTKMPNKSISQMIKATESLPSLDFEDEELVKEQLTGGLSVPLESVNFTFQIANISRTCTHQLVRTRIGAGMSQQSMRWTNMSKFNFRIPKTLKKYNKKIKKIMGEIDKLYKDMVMDDIPYQDARFILPMGTTTWIYITYNLLSLKNVLNTRLCYMMQWEIREVASQMRDEVIKVFPQFKSILVPRCELIKKCLFPGWEDVSECSLEYAKKRMWKSKKFGQKK